MINDVLGKVCTGGGFCIPPADHDRICAISRLTTDRFARDVLAAEGFNPDIHTEHLPYLREAFVDHFGHEDARYALIRRERGLPIGRPPRRRPRRPQLERWNTGTG